MAVARHPVDPRLAAFLSNIAAAPSRVSVVVPVYNHPENLEKCLAAVRAANASVEIVVVDDCSTEDVHTVAEKFGARYIRLTKRSGAPAARNCGWRAAHGDVIAFVDSDVVVPSDALEHVHQLLSENPVLAGVFGSYDDEPADCTFYSQFRNLLHHYIHQFSKEQAHTFWTGCGALRRAVLEETGGFDEALAGMDDVELGMRICRRGNLLYLDKSLQVKHLKKWTLASTLHTDIFLRAVPWTQLLVTRSMVPRDLNLGYRSRFSAILVMLLFLTLLATPVYVWQRGLAHSAPVLVVAAMLVGGLCFINHTFYAFLARKRGLLFTGAAMVAHWFYYFYSGATFLIVWLGMRTGRIRWESAITTPRS